MHWYYERNGVSCGPHDDSEMAQMLLENRLTAEDLIWRPGMGEWQSLHELNPGWLRTPQAPPEPPMTETPTRPLPTEAPVAPKLRPHAPSPEPETEKPGLLKRLFGFGKKKK